MSLGRRFLDHVIRDAHEDEPRRAPLKSLLLLMTIPAIGAGLGAIGGGLVGVQLLLAAGHGVGHSGAAAGIVLGLGGLCILVGAALGMGVALTIATLVRAALFVVARRPWPWRGSVHLGALLFAIAVVSGIDHLARNPAASAADSAATVVRMAADVAGLVLSFPAAILGGLTGSWLHRRRARRPS